MTRSEFLFKAIDVMWHPLQNYRRYPHITREEDFAYDESKPDICRGEFYYDPTLINQDKKIPVVLNIHGGGFVKGDKRHRASLCKRFAHHGYFTMNINYSLSPKNKFPTPIIDCINAINYLKKVEEKYNLDLTKVCVTGDSSGAYMATQIVAVCHDETLRAKINAPKVEVVPAVLVPFCGPFDIESALAHSNLPFHIVWDIGNNFIGTDFGLKKDFSNLSDYEYIRELSPLNFINDKWCPTFIVMSKKDMFCKGHGELLEEKLIEKGVIVESFSSSRLIDNHCYHFNMFTKISKDTFKKVFEFMAKFLKQ